MSVTLNLLILILILPITSCTQVKEEVSSNSNRPKQPDFVERAETPKLFSPLGGDDFNTALSNYVRTKYPGSAIKGIAEEVHAANMYLIAVDISYSAKGEIIHVIGRIFTANDGNTYWKMEPPTYDLLRLMNMIERNQNEQNDIDNERKKYDIE